MSRPRSGVLALVLSPGNRETQSSGTGDEGPAQKQQLVKRAFAWDLRGFSGNKNRCPQGSSGERGQETTAVTPGEKSQSPGRRSERLDPVHGQSSDPPPDSRKEPRRKPRYFKGDLSGIGGCCFAGRVRACLELRVVAVRTRGDYGTGETKEKFKYATTLVLIQCVINALFAKLLIQFFEKPKPDRTRSWLYGVCSLSYLGAMVSSNSALQFVNYPTQVSVSRGSTGGQLPHTGECPGAAWMVSYPTQVLGKSCKPIPVMILGVTILRKKYPMSKYLCVLLIVGGVALFMYKPKKGLPGADEYAFGFGEMLLLLSLTLDGLTGVAQDHMRAHFQTGSNQMMLNINLWSTLMLGAGVLWTGEVWEFLSFTDRYPSILYNIVLFGLTSALGQLGTDPCLVPLFLQSFIFMTVVSFGPLTCSIITTTRKFFTILGSVLIFGNTISSMQWVGTMLVFLGESMRTLPRYRAGSTSHST
ncbi:UNVERIFIED_CONTAM: hypothetical protein FKN15_070828 [Acipenser sinensis]